MRAVALLSLVPMVLLSGCDDEPAADPPVVVLPDARPDDPPDAAEPDAHAPDLATPDAAAPDMAAPDAAAPDMAAPDMGAPSAGALCDPCLPDGTCAPGGLCLTNQNTGEQFCGSACQDDADCPRGTSCFELPDGTRQCVPNGATCADFPPPDQGAPCADDEACVVEVDRCVPAGDVGYCSVDCADDGDCPPGYDRCVDGVCRAVWELGPEGCGRDPTSALPPCGADGACADGLVCATDLLDPWPDTIAPFCTRGCDGDADCPGGTTCQPTAGGSMCLDARCACVARPADQALLDRALDLAGLDRCSAGFDRSMFALLRPDVAHDPFRLSFFDPAHRSATGGLTWARSVQRDLAERAEGDQPLAALIVAGAAVLDAPIDAAAEAFPAGGEAPLLDALVDAGADRDAAAAALEPVPADLRRDLARVLRAALAVAEARDTAAAEARLDAENLAAVFDLVPSTMVVRGDFTGVNMAAPIWQRLLNGGFPLRPLFAAGRDLAHTIDAVDWADHAGAEGFAARIETEHGAVIINDAGVQTVEGDHSPLLLFDAGGDDIYTAPVAATSGPDRPVAVLIEVGGNDRYGFVGDDAEPDVADLPPADRAGRYDGSHPQVGDAYGPISQSTIARQGVGIMGVGLLVDLSGDDTYLSHKVSQGAGVLGLGAILDRAGADDYRCEQGCQGAGAYGMGLLVDRGVEGDRYLGVQAVQGYAYVRAFGYLHDEGGDDDYRALFGDPELGGAFLYPNAQNATSNTSLAQGAGFGRRADFSDQIFASGGLGVFRDGGGVDRYQVDVFGQGSGFWFGTGLFSDGGGDDIYEGRWYVQGSGAHFAMSFFFEEGGDDVYNRPETMIATAVGQGHDMSLGWLIDEAGDDTWVAPGLGLGAGNDNGIGLFVDLAGADTYRVPDNRTFGGASTGDRGAAFEEALCLGIFIDADGVDDYGALPDAPMSDDTTWTWEGRRGDARKPGTRGAGVDVTGGVLVFP